MKVGDFTSQLWRIIERTNYIQSQNMLIKGKGEVLEGK
jgi:hypothetical protein